MKVLASQIRRSVNARYFLWDQQMVVRVMQHTGVYGFHSAVIVVEQYDDPLQVFTWDGYKILPETQEQADVGEREYLPHLKGSKPSMKDMLEWIAAKLTELSTGTEWNEGACGDVQGLLA